MTDFSKESYTCALTLSSSTSYEVTVTYHLVWIPFHTIRELKRLKVIWCPYSSCIMDLPPRPPYRLSISAQEWACLPAGGSVMALEWICLHGQCAGLQPLLLEKLAYSQHGWPTASMLGLLGQRFALWANRSWHRTVIRTVGQTRWKYNVPL